MGLFDRVRALFGKQPGPYEEAQKERVEAVRNAVPEGAPTLDHLLAMVALVSVMDEKDVGADSRLLEDLDFGDLEYMEIEILCEDLFGVEISSSDLNLADTLGDLAGIIDRKRGIDPREKAKSEIENGKAGPGEEEKEGAEGASGRGGEGEEQG